MDAEKETRPNLLIVDDNVQNLHLLSHILSQNYQTHTVARGAEALELARKILPDLVLLDVMMPEMDGFEVCERLKSDELTRRIPVVFISALNVTAEKVKAFKMGGVDYITKPFQIEEVLMRVATHLSLRQLQKSLEAELIRREELIAELNAGNARLQTEIAEREHAETALELSREHFRTVSDHTYNWELWMGSGGYPIYISPSCQRITGYRREEFQKDPGLITGIVHPEDRAAWIRHLNFDQPSQEIFSFNLRIITRDGDVRWIGHTCQPVYDRSGVWAGRRVSNRDITEQVQAEQQLRQYAAELEAQNAELDAFAHTVAHDLKNPLAALAGFSYVLKQRAHHCQPEQIEAGAETIYQSIQKTTAIIDGLLLLSKVRRLTDIEIALLDMAGIVVEVQNRLRSQITKACGEILLPPNWPAAYGYAPWIEEVWANYISNALKYGGAPPQIELGWDMAEGRRMKDEGREQRTEGEMQEVGRGEQEEENGEQPAGSENGTAMVRFWVRDNGAGLTPEQQERLFTQFTRLHKDRAEGHGLGLSIVQRIVSRLGGEVGVESAPGQGSRFYFTLPQSHPHDALTPSSPEPQ